MQNESSILPRLGYLTFPPCKPFHFTFDTQNRFCPACATDYSTFVSSDDLPRLYHVVDTFDGVIFTLYKNTHRPHSPRQSPFSINPTFQSVFTTWVLEFCFASILHIANMSLTVKHLNTDASFLLTFEPIPDFPPTSGHTPNSFTILLDPWIVGPSHIFHPSFSVSRHKVESCVKSLTELPEVDLVIISQDKSDHCHKETLTQLPGTGGKTLILAEPSAAKLIRSWKHFDTSKVISLKKWEDPRADTADKLNEIKSPTIFRIPLDRLSPYGTPGEVTITLLAQNPDLTRLHTAIGITYRAPSSGTSYELTPPSSSHSATIPTKILEDRALSVIHAPHGISYKTIRGWASAHLLQTRALPLTALLHCFDVISNPWYLGGNICSGFPTGRLIAENLCAKVWISAHDGEKDTTGVASLRLKQQKFEREHVESIISPRSEKFPERKIGTEAVVLDAGEEMRLTQAIAFGPLCDQESDDRLWRESIDRAPEMEGSPSPDLSSCS